MKGPMRNTFFSYSLLYLALMYALGIAGIILANGGLGSLMIFRLFGILTFPASFLAWPLHAILLAPKGADPFAYSGFDMTAFVVSFILAPWVNLMFARVARAIFVRVAMRKPLSRNRKPFREL